MTRVGIYTLYIINVNGDLRIINERQILFDQIVNLIKCNGTSQESSRRINENLLN